jgi:transposase InsO family protein
MSHSSDVYNNSATESFVSSLEIERVHLWVYATRAEARAAVLDCVERLYNSRRRHSKLKYLSPMEYENAEDSVQDRVGRSRPSPEGTVTCSKPGRHEGADLQRGNR